MLQRLIKGVKALTGIREATFEKLQLDAGAFFVNVDISQATDAQSLKTLLASELETEENLLGATRGSGSFECTPKLRTIEANGMRDPFIGSTRNDGWSVFMSGSLLEVTPENFKRVMMSAEVEGEGAVKTLTLRTPIKNEDYIPSVLWVGDTSKGFVVIEIKNALNTTGATFTFTDRNENVLPFRFQAHADDLHDMDYAPCRVIFFDEA